MADDNIDAGGEEGVEEKFVEVDGKKFVDDGSGQPKMGDDGQPIPFTEKFVETPEARKARLDKQVEQHRKKYPDLYKKPADEKDDEDDKKGKKGKKSDVLDYGQLAFYNSKSDAVKIESDEDVEFLRETIESTGKDQRSILASKWFQAELKERQAGRETADAVPGNGKRSGGSASNTVEYWIAKGGLPPNTPENQKLRQEIVNARIGKERGKSQFTDNPVVGKTS